VALLQRLHNGGENMPAFAYLSGAEIRALIGYLKQLADVPGAAREQIAVQETSARAGELIVKSTCHICHDATGVNPGPEDLLHGAIPPLSTLTLRTTEAGLVRKVTRGAPIAMGSLETVSGGRMPVFSYLTEDEASDVYLYLTQYPPESSPEQRAPAVQRAQISPSVASGNTSDPGPPHSGDDSGISPALVFSFATLFSLGLVAAGFIFTFREFSRITRQRAILISMREPSATEEYMLSVEDERKPA
jgi:mono/diheme cytochrome c family protein